VAFAAIFVASNSALAATFCNWSLVVSIFPEALIKLETRAQLVGR